MNIHTGYELLLDTIDEKSKEILRPLCAHTITHKKKLLQVCIKLKKKPYTAIVYNYEKSKSKSAEIYRWFTRKKGNPMFAIINELFIYPKNKVIVAQGTIDGIHTYITISKYEKNYSPIQLKGMVNGGVLGKPHHLQSPLKIPCHPYLYNSKNGFKN